MLPNKGKGISFENNRPVGSAGQPAGKEARMGAIQRRLASKRKKDAGAKN